MLPHHLTPSPTPPICALFSPHLPPPPIIPAVEGYLEQALLAAGMMLPSNFGDLFKIGWSRSSRTDKGCNVVAVQCGGSAMWWQCNVVAVQCGGSAMWWQCNVVAVQCALKGTAYERVRPVLP
ncbi:unnamed protein product, partial [Closterium sp. NIES-54]